jgi:hypothetical protein
LASSILPVSMSSKAAASIVYHICPHLWGFWVTPWLHGDFSVTSLWLYCDFIVTSVWLLASSNLPRAVWQSAK